MNDPSDLKITNFRYIYSIYCVTLTFSAISVLGKSLTLDKDREWVTTIIRTVYLSDLDSIVNKVIMKDLNLITFQTRKKYIISIVACVKWKVAEERKTEDDLKSGGGEGHQRV